MRAFALILITASLFAAGESTYVTSIKNWRKEREEKLRAPAGWLTVAGLFWLKEGENRAGSDPSSEIVLPDKRSPQKLGVFDFHNERTTFRAAPGAHVTVNGKAVTTAELAPDSSGHPDMLQSGDLTMFVIKRGPKYGIRLRDVHSSMRETFHGLDWYPVKAEYRIVANFTSHPKPATIPIPNILGQTEQEPSPGYATFQLAGKTYRLDPVLEGDRLFFIFRDATSGRSTYGAGRFLYTDLAKDGKLVLDFNKAENPPCAFTPYATCPLPPKQNRLSATIEAGEKKYGDH